MDDFTPFPAEDSFKFLFLYYDLPLELAAYIVAGSRPKQSISKTLKDCPRIDIHQDQTIFHQDIYTSKTSFEVDHIIATFISDLMKDSINLRDGKLSRPKIKTTDFILWAFKRHLLDANKMKLDEHFKMWSLNETIYNLDSDALLVMKEFITRGTMKLGELKTFLSEENINGFPGKLGHEEAYKIHFILPKKLKKTKLITPLKSEKGGYQINPDAKLYRFVGHSTGKHCEVGWTLQNAAPESSSLHTKVITSLFIP